MSASRMNTDFYFRMKPAGETEIFPRQGSLTNAVEAAVGNLDDQLLRTYGRRSGLSALDAKRLLALLAWCYARELYCSAEIHSRLRRGRTAEWDNGIPDVEQISEFRMENRMALQSCLEVALQFLAAQKVAEGLVTHVRREHITADASRRIVAAIFIDSMEATGPLAAAC